MKIIAVANVEQQQEILEKKINTGAEIIFTQHIDTIAGNRDYDAFFILDELGNIDAVNALPGKLILINSVVETLEGFPENVGRINGWSGFLKREVWEIAAKNEEMFSKIFDALGWEILFVKDEPGLIAARVLAMIINEAYFVLGENVSSEKDIDLAMKLGTNYPYGPFEWSKKIGLGKIYTLLSKLTETDKRYSVAPALKKQLSIILQ